MELDRLTTPAGVAEIVKKLDAGHIGHELVMTDNLHGVNPDPAVCRSLSEYPAKIVGAMIVFCVSGTVSFRVNLSVHTVGPREVIVILPGSIIQIETACDLRIAVISFGNHYYEDIIDVTPRMRENPVMSLSESDFNECLDIYTNLKNHIEGGDIELSKAIATGYIKVVCSLIFDSWRRNIEISGMPALSRRKLLYRRFLAEVQADCREHRSLRHYADVLCVTPKYLSMVVKMVSGRNASEYIDELVSLESKTLLLDSRYSIQQVSDMMNFPNPSFFAKFFRHRCGISPSAYRKQKGKFSGN